MAQHASQKPLIIQCPRCHWRAPAPPNWEAPFAVCPKCDARVPNPDPQFHLEARERAKRRSNDAPQRIPAGYQFKDYSLSNHKFDHWVRNLAIVGVALAAIVSTFKIIINQRQRSPGHRPEVLATLAADEDDALPALPPGLSGFDSNPEEESDDPNTNPRGLTAIHWDSNSVFKLDGGNDSGEGGLWDATEAGKEPLALPPSSFRDPSLPPLDPFE